MLIKKLSALFLTVLLSSSACAQVFIMGEFGRSKFNFDDEFLFAGFDGRVDEADSLSFMTGYRFSSNVVVAANLGITSNELPFNFSDDFQLYEAGAHLGYAFDLGDRFRIVPMLGMSIWEFDAQEDAFLSSGGQERRESSGADIAYRLNLEFPINEVLQLSLSFIGGDYDFGQVTAARFGFKFSL